jgi:Fic family protein
MVRCAYFTPEGQMGNLLVHVAITPDILMGVSEAARLLGQIEGHRCTLKSQTRNEHRVSNIHASLALSGNTLSREEVGALLRGEQCGAEAADQAQASAYIHAYKRSGQFSVTSRRDLFSAYLLMNEGHPLTSPGDDEAAASWNARMKESLELMGVLLRYIEHSQREHPIVNAAVFHYQMYHVRPFGESTDAVARLWHRLLLGRFHQVLRHAPLELLFKKNAQAYREALGEENSHDGQQRFIAFSLVQVSECLKILLDGLDVRSQGVDERLLVAKMHFGERRLTRKAYMTLFRTIGPATASRDLKAGLDAGLLSKNGKKARTEYYFI